MNRMFIGVALLLLCCMSIVSACPFRSTDINGDGTVDIFDIVLVAIHFGSNRCSCNFYEQADINRDGKINMIDLELVAGDM